MKTRPVVFGDGCFGLFHAAEPHVKRDVVAVVCPTIGYEAVCSHRSLRILAEELAQNGVDTFRFDYHGTGDSLGDDRMPRRFDAWIASIDFAIDAARKESGAKHVIVIGLRIGANLAAEAASRRSDVGGLVLIAPCVSGRSFVRETRVFRLLAAAQEGYTPPAEGDELDAAGFVLTNETINDLTQRLKWPQAKLAERILVLGRDDTATDAKLISVLEASGTFLEQASLPGYRAMMVDPHATVAPCELIEKIVSWTQMHHPVDPSRESDPTSPRQGEKPVRLLGECFVEEARRFGSDGRVFGIVTQPVTKELRRGTVVLLNPGSVHHIGSNRMHVTWARAWAKLGFTVARIDVGGIGESPAARGQRENETYSKSAVPDIDAVTSELSRTSDCGPIVLIGLCSGAYAAFHTALASGTEPRASTDKLSSIVLINPQTFHFRPGDTLEVSSLSESRRYRSSLFEASKWQRLIRGKVDVRNAAKALFSLASVGLKAQIDRRLGGPDVARELRKIVDLNIDVLMIYASKDPGLDYLSLHVGKATEDLAKRARFRIELMEPADHTFTIIDAQHRLQEVLRAHLERLGPRRIKKPTPPS